MNMQLSPSNPIVRAIYCLSLVSVAVSLLRTIGMFNFNAGAVLMLFIALAPNVVLLLLVAFRFAGVAIGKFKLNVAATTGPIYILRMLAISFMFVSVSVALFGFIGVLSSSRPIGVGYVFISGIYGGGPTIGLVLFEASRLFEREMLLESKPNT
jgi:hypothetical protein